MIFKILLLGIALYLIYKFFFNKKTKLDNETKQIEEELIDCPKCGTYVSKQDAILSNGKYYCSNECLPR